MAYITECTQALCDKIGDALRSGSVRPVAALIARVRPDTLSSWVDAGDRAEKRRESEGEDALTDEDRLHADLAFTVALAEAEWESRIVKHITDRAEQDWRAGAYLLRCRRPDTWNPVRPGATPGATPVALDGRAPDGRAPNGGAAGAQPAVYNRIVVLPDSRTNPTRFQDCPTRP